MENLKNYLLNQDISGIKKDLKRKVFDYFYTMLDGKATTTYFTLYLLHSIEIIQLISFAFSSPHLVVWKLPEKFTNILNSVLSGFRLTPLFYYVSIDVAVYLLIIIFVFIVIFFVLLIVQISCRKENSSFFEKLMSFTQLNMPVIVILLFIPINELLFSSMNCRNNHINLRNEEVNCWKSAHLIFVLISIIGIILYLIPVVLLTFFYFYPFITQKVTIKLTAKVDLILIIIKFIFVIQKTFVKNEYASAAILLILSLYLVYYQNKEPIYNDKTLELFLNIRNIFLLWTNFILLIAIISYNSNIISLIYLLVCGYPLVIYTYIMYFNEKNNQFNFNQTSVNNVNICLSQLRLLLKLIDSFFYEKKQNLNIGNNEGYNQQNDLLLKGIIKMHTINCLKEDCPLTKFIRNKGNYNIQKQCLLNYMAAFFNNSIKKFPNSVLIRMQFIQFNYDKKYNLNNIKATLEEIKKMRYNLSSEFILYCQEKEISKIRSKDVNDDNDEEKEKLLLDQNYKKLKTLIANSTKLYVEFWGIFAANITNNLNTQKLYKLGEQLNTYLKEINHLWEKNLKNKKLDIENENNAQLYCKFLREILWDQNKSDAVQKKINEEHNMHSYNRDVNEEKNQLDNLDNLETQDYLLFISVNDKGKTSILQFSNSLSELIGYQKSELISKPIETLMPPILAESHARGLEGYIKVFSSKKNSENNSLQMEDKMKQFILLKTKMGYLLPFTVRYVLYDNNDFSNNFLIKAILESKDVKSMYAYYLLTKPDFSLENITSSAIHLGFSMDLLKKYVIKLNVLIRTNSDENLNLYDRYKEFKDEAVKVTWVDPGVIYPKDDLSKSKLKDIPIQDLIKKSQKTKMLLQIFEIKNENEIIAFIFKLYEKKNVKNKKEFELKKFIPGVRNQIIFDLLTLNYIRAIIVKEKTGFRNLRENEDDKDNMNNLTIAKSGKKGIVKTHDSNIIEELSGDEKEEIVITKDKILDLQTKDSNGIKSFINMLPFFGNEISLIKHRPNREQYPAGKAQEPQIKIDASKYTKLIDSKLKENPKLYKRIKNMQKEQRNNNEDENIPIKENFMNEDIKQDENKGILMDDINRNFSTTANVSLINVINISSIQLVKVVDFFIYFFVIVITTLHFILTYDFFQKNSKRFTYFKYSYQLLNDVIYVKYFVSEGIYINEVQNYSLITNLNKTSSLNDIKGVISGYGSDIADIIYQFNNPKIELPDEYREYVSNTNMTLKTNNAITKTDQQPFSSALNKLTTSIFYISSSDKDDFNMENNYAYELMVNLMDSYFVSFERIILIMLKYLDDKTNDIKIINISIFIVSFVISVIYLILFYRMMVKLDKDREKPLNLFLTIKNKVFEDLKNSSENFSNKLLNRFFQVDGNEEESQQNYSKINIKPNDINIAKFKALNEYKSLNKKENSFMIYFIQLVVFYGLLNIIIFLEYLNATFFCDKINNYIHIYNSTYTSEIYLVTRINIIKQYFYNNSITNYNFNEDVGIYNFLYAFLFMSQEITPTVKETSKTNSFLEDEYKGLFKQYFYGNYSDLIINYMQNINNSQIYETYLSLTGYIEYGYSSINSRIFEILRYLSIKYFMNPEKNLNKNISALINHNFWDEINKLLLVMARPWYQNMEDLISSYYISYTKGRLNMYIFLFIILLIVISLYYWIAWKHYEDKFIDSIQKSFYLINLIPEEIKNIIINKLNEN